MVRTQFKLCLDDFKQYLSMLALELNGELGNARSSGSDVRLGCEVAGVPRSDTPKLHPLTSAGFWLR
jgi:hypothetical protein